VAYRLLEEFANLFTGKRYLHRNSSLGDFVALHLYEDLLSLGKSARLTERIATHEWVLNRANQRQGVRARRCDGTFGELVPGEKPLVVPDYQVARGIVATIEIGAEVKILAKAMIKQIDRVIGDLQKQVAQFKQRGGKDCICVGIVGINQAAYTIGYEGERAFKTDGKANRHPIQEATEAERRLRELAQPVYDEFVVLHYKATNDEPYLFEWVDTEHTTRDYGASLLRISREYERRFK
jgi:hypothetical protein